MDTGLIGFVGNGHQIGIIIKMISDLPNNLFYHKLDEGLRSEDLEARLINNLVELYPRKKIANRIDAPNNAKDVRLDAIKSCLFFHIPQDNKRTYYYCLYPKNPYSQPTSPQT